ncbi:MAG: hypothetical protein KDI30_07130 [Pseudomonadales bacterium]|nr:hypothetical protein [Pseudomonadales bacterium]
MTVSNDREQPEIPSIVLDADDIAMRKRDVDISRQGVSGTSDKAVSGKNLSWLWLLLLFLALLGAQGFYFYKQMQIQNEIHDLAVQRIVYLENRLSSTDSNLVESAESLAIRIQSMDESLKEAHSEIRKLWGVSYDRNKKAIAENVATLSSLEKKIEQQADKLQKHDQQLFDKEKQVVGIQTKVHEMTGSLDRLEGLANEAVHRAEMVSENTEQIKDRLDVLNQSVKQYEELNKSLEKKLVKGLADTDDAIKGIDVYRKSINREIETLREELLKNKQNTEAGSTANTPQPRISYP